MTSQQVARALEALVFDETMRQLRRSGFPPQAEGAYSIAVAALDRLGAVSIKDLTPSALQGAVQEAIGCSGLIMQASRQLQNRAVLAIGTTNARDWHGLPTECYYG